MGYFDGLTDAAFKEDEKGNAIFYPFGILSKGRVIPNKDEKQYLRNLLKRYYQIFFPLTLMTAAVAGWIWTFAIAVGSLLPLYLLLFVKTKSYEVASTSLKFTESAHNSARSHSRGTLWMLLVVGIVFVVLSLLMFVTGFESRFISGACIIFFGLCSYSIGRMIRLKDN